MEETVIVIMIKEKQTGFLDKELISCIINKHDDLMLNAFAFKEEDELYISIKLVCQTDVSDWEYDAILDYYDTDIYESKQITCHEVSDCFNPTWELTFKYDEDSVEETINRLLEMHHNELLDVLETIKDKESEYCEGEFIV